MARHHASCQGFAALQEPTDEDIVLTEKLNRSIKESEFFETHESLDERKSIVQSLEDRIVEWIQKVAKKQKNQFKTPCEKYGTCVLPFGGHALGVVPKGGDLDVVCLAPNFISHSDFFSSLVECLHQCMDVEDIRKVEAAYVPLLQFTMKQLKVDLSLAVLNYENIPKDLNYDTEDILLQIDQTSVRSLSGIRDANALKTMVPNKETFTEAVKAVKIWAKRNGIHGASFGYPGGIAWNIMVARVCQMYPAASASRLVCHFFQIFSHWNWPEPVLLQPIMAFPSELSGTCIQWDAKKHASDRCHLMPVITPSFPEHNSCFTVNSSSRQIIQDMLHQGKTTCEKIVQGQLTWQALFQPIDFFTMYKHYLMAAGKAGTEQGILDWAGYLESQLRKLVEALQLQQAIQQIHLYPKPHHNRENRSVKWFLGLKLKKLASASLDLSTPMHSFAEQCKSIAIDRGIFQDDMKLEIIHIPRKNIGEYIDTTSTGT